MSDPSSDLTPEDDWAADLTGAILDDRYQVEGLLGTGGMGAVYRGRQIKLRKQVAIKVLRPEYAHRDVYVRRFLLEARAASTIAHRHVVEVTDFGEASEGRVYFVMEYLEGEDLAKLIRRLGRVQWSRTRGLLLQIVRALKAAHGKGIIHRDIKPANIFLTQDAEEGDFIKVLDFGIAKFADPLDSAADVLTNSNQMLGTAMYMAPEQALGREVTARSDVYALGAVAFQMLTGHAPFQGVTPFEILMVRVNGPPPGLQALAPEVTAEVEALVQRAMARDPAERFADMAELEAAITAIPDDACSPAVSSATDSAAEDTSTSTSARGLLEPMPPKTELAGTDGAAESSPRPGEITTIAAPPIPDPRDGATEAAVLAVGPDKTEAAVLPVGADETPRKRSYGWLGGVAVGALVVTAVVLVMRPSDPPGRSKAPPTPVPEAAIASAGSARPLAAGAPQANPTQTTGGAQGEASPVEGDDKGSGETNGGETNGGDTNGGTGGAGSTSGTGVSPLPPDPKPKDRQPRTVQSQIRRASSRAKRKCRGAPGGSVTVGFLVDSGTAHMLRIVETTQSPAVAACVRSQFEKATFPPGNGGLQKVVVKF